MRKRRLKLIHGGIMIFTLLLTIIALVAVFDSHNLKSPPIPNMYTLHSWVGLTSVILFCCQVRLKKFLPINFDNVHNT
jgi:cytochrome b-561